MEQPPVPDSPGPAMGISVESLVEAIRESRPMVAAMLSETRMRLGGGQLLIEVPSEVAAIRAQLETRESTELLQRTAESMLGGPVRVTFATEGDKRRPAATPPPAETPRPSAAAETAETPRKRPEHPPESRPTRRGGSRDSDGLLAAARQEPAVRKLLDTFGAQVVEIKPDRIRTDPPNDGEA